MEFTSVEYSLEIVEEVGLCCIFADIRGNTWTGWTLYMGFPEASGGAVLELPEDANIDALASDSGAVYFSVDQTVVLDGMMVRPADVVRRAHAGGVFSLAFDAAAAGIPDGVNLDAFTLAESAASTSTLAVSFDTTVVMSGLGPGGALFFVVVDDEDLVFGDAIPFFDGSAAGIPEGADLNGAHYIGDAEQLLLTFDVHLDLDGVRANDEGTLLYDVDNNVWQTGPTTFVSANNDLDALMATNTSILFADGFESGDTSAW